MDSRFYKKYKDEVVPALVKDFGYKNVMQAPRISKVVVNVGYGRMAKDAAMVENIYKTLTLITGQKPVHNKAKKSISNFKIREDMNIGCSVTLRGKRMYDFLDKLISMTLPRVKDFQGINPKSFDKHGNYTLGFKENLAFPEITVESLDKVHGLEMTICTTADSDKEAFALLKKLGFPFREK